MSQTENDRAEVYGKVRWKKLSDGSLRLQQHVRAPFVTDSWVDVLVEPPAVRLESEDDVKRADVLASKIANAIFRYGDCNGHSVNRMAFKAPSSKVGVGEVDLGGLCMRAMVNVIRTALLEHMDSSRESD